MIDNETVERTPFQGKVRHFWPRFFLAFFLHRGQGSDYIRIRADSSLIPSHLSHGVLQLSSVSYFSKASSFRRRKIFQDICTIHNCSFCLKAVKHMFALDGKMTAMKMVPRQEYRGREKRKKGEKENK